MRLWTCGWLLVGACSDEPTKERYTTETDPYVPPASDICDPIDGMAVADVVVAQPWSEHEAELTVTLSSAATVAVACQRDGEPSEVHLVEGAVAATEHTLRLAGLLADTLYRCAVAPVCPSSPDGPLVVDLQTGPESNAQLPPLELTLSGARAGREYILTNSQNSGPWNGQRRLVFDRAGGVRWHSAINAGGGAGGPSVNYHSPSGTFTIGGGWPPNNNGRPQQLDLFGSTVLFDAHDALPNAADLLFHHEARQLADGRFLTLEEATIQQSGGGTFTGVGVHLVDADTNSPVFTWTSQGAYDAGALPGGGSDAYHPNWADVVDDVLHISLCYQHSVIAVDVPSGAWRWLFGPGGDFDLVDPDGAPLSDSEYPQCQHGLQRRGDKLLVYDNGQQRGFSRAVEYQLDEGTMTATKLWDWTEPHWFENSLGGVDYTEAGVLVTMGHIESATPSPGDHTTFVEIDPETGEKLWEVQYVQVTDMAYRAEVIPPCDLFANAAWCDATDQRVRALAPVLDVD